MLLLLLLLLLLSLFFVLKNRYVGLNGGGFTNAGGLTANALKAPKKKTKPKKEKTMGDRAGNYFVKKLNNGINAGLGAVGAG